MANTIREDVVQISFDIGDELTKLSKDFDDLKKKLTGGVGNDTFDRVRQGANDTVKPLKKVKEAAGEVGKKLTEVGKKAATVAFNGLKKLAAISFKALTVGIGAAATAIGGLVAKSVSAYAEFEQLTGGVETLFKDSAGIVQKYANNAYKTAGLSANEYMETVTSFSASLLQSLGGDTAEAAKYADMAISDMSDNANKMGTDMGSIQYAYQGFAKQNYTMLDNLKLGYGGTKTEMERLVKDAAKIDKSVDANSMSYGNIVKAIHAVQMEMDIYGTTQKEAEHTISGSLASMKSAWGNLLPALIQGGDSFDQCVDNLIESVLNFKDNIKPALQKALSGIGRLIEELAPTIEKELPTLIEELLPPLIKAAVAIVQGLIKALPSIVRTLAKEIPNVLNMLIQTIVDTFGEKFNVLFKISDKIGNFFKENGEKIIKFIPALLGLVAAFKAFKVVKSVTSIFSSGKGGSGGIFGGITNIFQNLAKTKVTTVLKGMANLAIIIGGVTLITAALMAVAPHIAKLSDGKSIAELLVAILAVGVVGTALAKLADIAGKIPVSKAAKGLANMAIVITGMSALFMLIAAMSLLDYDYKKMLLIATAITVLGVVGTALSIFAGIAGIIPVATVAKGLANIAIAITGMSALFLLIAAVSLLTYDFRKILKITEILAVLGAVGAALTIFAGVAGLIPIPVVLAGLANIALVIGGLTALIVAYGALSEIPNFTDFITKGGDTLALLFEQIGKIAGSLIGGIGEGISKSLPAIGENLSKFAMALKPLFTVFAGADMSGIGAFFAAIGGFMLQVAANNIVSFFTGGIDFAGMGEQLSTFATGSEDFFKKVAKFPAAGFSNATLLFQSLSDMGNIPSTGGVVQWFTGTTDYSALADGLKQLSSDSVVGFYNKVAALPQAGFDGAKALFQSLADIGKIPSTGGVAQWFTGTIDFDLLTSGFNKLATDGVAFYNTVATLPAAGFENAKLLFQSLSDIGNIPSTGGVVQWFTGETDISGLAKKLPPFGKAMAKFYNSISVISDYGKITELFKALKGIDEAFPKSGGFAQLFTGENDIVGVGENLKQFGEDTKSFFTTVNTLDVSNVNSLWNSVKKASEVADLDLSGLEKNGETLSNFMEKAKDFFTGANGEAGITEFVNSIKNALVEARNVTQSLTAEIADIMASSMAELVDKVSKLPITMGDGLKNNGKSLSDKLVSVWQDAAKASATPVNKVLDGANWILKEFGSEETIAKWTPYANGTNGHKGGNALVNDGKGAELVQMPNGNTFIPCGKNVFIPNAPAGMKVLPADQTAAAMGKKSPTFNYAEGTGDIDIWSYIDNAKGLVSAVADKFVNYEGVTGIALKIGKGMVKTITGKMSEWVEKLFGENGGVSIAGYVASKGVEQWRSTVIRALKMEGQYNPANVQRTLMQMQTESGGNPRAINLWDSNAKKGIPSKGLMQCIDPTFNAYRGVGYANGGIATKPSIFGESGAEMAIPLAKNKRNRGLNLWQQTGEMFGLPSYTPESAPTTTQNNNVTEQNNFNPQFNLTITGTNDDRAMARKVKNWVAEAIEDTFDSMSRKNPRLREV